jgi:Fungal protein kinase
MASDSSPAGAQVSRGDPKRTTPINTGSRTLYRFGDKRRDLRNHYLTLSEEMSPYFVGPMPASAFLSEFLPMSKLPEDVSLPLYEKGMFEAVIPKEQEADMYEPLVCPCTTLFRSRVHFSSQVTALTHPMSNYRIYNTSNSEERAKTNFPFKIKPDCSVFAKGHSFHGTDSSAVELLIEFKRQCDDDPFIKDPPLEKSSASSSDGTTPSRPRNPLMKTSQAARLTCGKITAYATSHMSAQYRTHAFSILICSDYARLIRWDRSGAIVTDPILYNEAPELFDFFIRFNHSPPEVRGLDTTVRLAKSKDTRDAVKAVKELEKSQVPLVVVSIPNPAAGDSLPYEYVVASPIPSPWIPVGRWTRTSIGYDIQREKQILLKDSWRLVIDGVLKEGDVYSRFKAHKVPNVPRCSNSGDIGDDEYHSPQTGRFVHADWAISSRSDLTLHRHYRLILDDIGQPLDSFARSFDMVRAVYAALRGKFSFVE